MEGVIFWSLPREASGSFLRPGSTARNISPLGLRDNNVRELGLTLPSPSADVSIPSSLASLVSGVAGLDESYEFIRPTHSVGSDAPPSAGFRNSPPFSA